MRGMLIGVSCVTVMGGFLLLLATTPQEFLGALLMFFGGLGVGRGTGAED